MAISTQEVFDFIQSHTLATLSTVTPEGIPHGTPIYYAWHPESRTLSLVTPAKTTKKRNMDTHRAVCLTITDEEELTMIRIQATVTENSSLVPKTLHQLAEKLGNQPQILESLPLMKYTDQSKTAYEIRPTSIQFDRYNTNNLERYSVPTEEL